MCVFVLQGVVKDIGQSGLYGVRRDCPMVGIWEEELLHSLDDEGELLVLVFCLVLF